ncbi:Domain of unknown function DUF2520 [Coriobacterium glomerans PW2]|uniref:DUF2520 domain-containing protein n=1 Tax=Coriobacterium glomerans (strain ATCC 49209 / DSM 20642 / JCM 10262 / PW2) TaxID=700015 RepID=F2N7R5_CORGP|nr:Domain of unknown function DUF2520 [Coriobacterium glomerans PW2]
MKATRLQEAMQTSAGFIGAGRVGTALGRYLVARGVAVSGYASLHRCSAEFAAECTSSRAFGDIGDLCSAADIIFLTVPDEATARVWLQMRRTTDLDGAIVCHCSGCLTSEVFEGAAQEGAHVCSAHPLLAFSDPLCSLASISRAHIALEGDEVAVDALRGLFELAGNPIHRIDAASKVRYHAAAVFASNLVIAPLSVAVRLLGEVGISEPDALSALGPLIEGNAHAFCTSGAAALTGPAERGDTATVAEHLAALDAPTAALYRHLTRMLIDLARVEHPDRDYARLAAIVEEKTS